MASLADVFESRARYAVEPCDCRFGMSSMPSGSVDAIVCDPPYGIGFMGKAWDSFSPAKTAARVESKRRKNGAAPVGQHGTPGELASASIEYDRTGEGNRRFQAWVTEWAREALRVLKPGGHIVSFGGTRTWHRLAVGIEDAGFEVRDNLAWLFGSGFPKSLNVSKAIDAALGADRAPDEYSGPNGKNGVYGANMGGGITLSRSDSCTAAAAAAAGFGTALKPSFEPVVLARNPLDGTVAANWMKYGTGALNIDGCRVDGEFFSGWSHSGSKASENVSMSGRNYERDPLPDNPLGRWPANVLLDDEAAVLLDEQAGEHPGMSGGGVHRDDYQGGMFGKIDCAANARNDSGGPSRFFYTAKASRSERDAGLDDFAARSAGAATGREDGSAGLTPRAGAGRSSKDGVRNIHPTVKPVDLMRWLVRLVGRKGALILDPFTGSGTTGVAAMLEGMRFVGLELEPLHVDFARARIAHVVGGTWEREVKPERPVEKVQPSLFDAIGASK